MHRYLASLLGAERVTRQAEERGALPMQKTKVAP